MRFDYTEPELGEFESSGRRGERQRDGTAPFVLLCEPACACFNRYARRASRPRFDRHIAGIWRPKVLRVAARDAQRFSPAIRALIADRPHGAEAASPNELGYSVPANWARRSERSRRANLVRAFTTRSPPPRRDPGGNRVVGITPSRPFSIIPLVYGTRAALGRASVLTRARSAIESRCGAGGRTAVRIDLEEDIRPSRTPGVSPRPIEVRRTRYRRLHIAVGRCRRSRARCAPRRNRREFSPHVKREDCRADFLAKVTPHTSRHRQCRDRKRGKSYGRLPAQVLVSRPRIIGRVPMFKAAS